MDKTHYTPIQIGKCALNLSGQRFGRLTAIAPVSKSSRGALYWLCKCTCGNEKAIAVTSLRKGISNSCGCLRSEQKRKQLKTHGMSKTRAYKNWQNMHKRCYDTNHISYPYYGARGITVCERWQKFETFYADMDEKPSKLHSIERIDNDGNYCPENCTWTTAKQQAINRRSTRFITIDGVTKTLSDWGRFYGLSKGVIAFRLKSGWDTRRAVTTPARKKRSTHHKAKSQQG